MSLVASFDEPLRLADERYSLPRGVASAALISHARGECLMIRLSLVAPAVVLGLIACADSKAPSTMPSFDRLQPGASAAALTGDADARTVRMYDSCDPATFNAVFNDPTICIKQGHVPFDRFIAELTQTQQAAQWRFAPKNLEIDPGGRAPQAPVVELSRAV
jgi:hypothetical protein